VDIDVTEPAPADSALRRRLLGIGLGGAAASLLPFLVGRASATTTTSTTPATTTTAPPKRPSDDDVALLGFAQTVEIAARNLYDIALATDDFDENERAVVATIREAHEAYSAALSGILGREAPRAVNPVFDDLKDTFGGDKASVLDAAFNLESVAVATHTEILGELQGTDGAALIASILIVEAAHGTVLATLNGATDLDILLVDTEADALTPAEG
jgi:Ferritin-like domain